MQPSNISIAPALGLFADMTKQSGSALRTRKQKRAANLLETLNEDEYEAEDPSEKTPEELEADAKSLLESECELMSIASELPALERRV